MADATEARVERRLYRPPVPSLEQLQGEFQMMASDGIELDASLVWCTHNA